MSKIISLLFCVLSASLFANDQDYLERISKIVQTFRSTHTKIPTAVISKSPQEDSEHKINKITLVLENGAQFFQTLNEIEEFDWNTGKRSDASCEMKQVFLHCARLYDSLGLFPQAQVNYNSESITVTFAQPVSEAYAHRVFSHIPKVETVISD